MADDPKELIIRLKLDKSLAEASNKEFVANAKKQTQQLLSDTEVAERAKLELIKRTNQQKVQEAARASKTEVEIARDSAKAQAEEARRSAREQMEAARETERAFIRAEREKSIAARVAAREQAAAAREAARVQREQAASMAAGMNTAARAATSFAGQIIGISSASAALSMIVGSFEKARDVALAAVDTVVHYREAILELAALKGQLGQSGQTVREDLAFRSKTLQTAEASNAFQQAALGVGESSIAGNGRPGLIEKDEFQKLMELAGSFQAAEGGSAQTHGRLAGMMPVLLGRQTNAQEAFTEEQALYQIFKPGGGTFTQLTNQYLENAPLVTSGLIDDRRMAALLSAFSVTNPQGAGTNVQQFARSTVGSLGRMRGANIEGDHEKQAEYLKRLGANNQMDMLQIGELISGDFEKQEAAAAGKGETFNAMDYLRHRGYMNQEDIMSLIAFHGLRKTGQMQNTFLPLTQQNISAQEAMAPILQAQASDPALLERKVQLGTEQANVARGAPLEYYEKLRRRAYDTLKAEGGTWGTFDEYQKDWWMGGEARLDREATKLMMEEYRKRGGAETGKASDFFKDDEVAKDFIRRNGGREEANLEQVENYLNSGGVTGLFETNSAEWRARKFQSFAQQLGSQGGDVLPGLDKLQQAADTMLQASQNFQNAIRPPGSAPPKVPSRPQVLQ